MLGSGVWRTLLDDSQFAKLKSTGPETAAYLDYLRSYQAIRTQFFDTYIADAVAGKICQLVIVASGLDARRPAGLAARRHGL